MAVGLLGLQGAFRDHIRHLKSLGVEFQVVRDAAGLKSVRRLILPGGESTVMGKFLAEFGMIEPLRERIAGGMPVWGICAGAILLADRVDGLPGRLRAMDMAVARNAYGRQLASTSRDVEVPVLDAWGGGGRSFPAVFIRSPRITAAGPQVAIHARSDRDPVFVQLVQVALFAAVRLQSYDSQALRLRVAALPGIPPRNPTTPKLLLVPCMLS